MIEGHIAKWLVASELARTLDKNFLEVVEYVERSVEGAEEVTFDSMVKLLYHSEHLYLRENG